MQIDYFTIIAQIINFLILVILLRHFLYQPLLRSMNEREQKISTRLKEAEQKRKEAEKDAELHSKILQEIEKKRQEMRIKVENEVQLYQKALMKEARDRVESSKAKWYEDFERQKELMVSDLSLNASEEICAIVRRALQDLADENLEHHILNNFIKRLEEENDLDNEKTMDFFRTVKEQITVESTFEIPEEMRHRIIEIAGNRTGSKPEMIFKIVPELICGVQLSTHDARIGWSVAGYLNSLKADVSRAIQPGKDEQIWGDMKDGKGRK